MTTFKEVNETPLSGNTIVLLEDVEFCDSKGMHHVLKSGDVCLIIYAEKEEVKSVSGVLFCFRVGVFLDNNVFFGYLMKYEFEYVD